MGLTSCAICNCRFQSLDNPTWILAERKNATSPDGKDLLFAGYVCDFCWYDISSGSLKPQEHNHG